MLLSELWTQAQSHNQCKGPTSLAYNNKAGLHAGCPFRAWWFRPSKAGCFDPHGVFQYIKLNSSFALVFTK